ncbi:MAG: hypothetical protein HFG27_09750 [Provencibacterium sp.]|jgi:hypothetical protein|nr:hypothetical protein [Provencibacterium sp.]
MKKKLLSLILSAALLCNMGVLSVFATEEAPAAPTVGASQQVCPECGGQNGAHQKGCPQDAVPEPDPEPEEQMVTGWQWVDEEEILTDGMLALPGASEQAPALLADVIALLPASILAQLEGEEEKTELTLAGWDCADYPEKGAYEGRYLFTARLPEGYLLSEEAPALEIAVELGGAELLAEPESIDMQYSGFVFANGIPIVIKKNGSITSIYDTDGQLLSGNTDVCNQNIYGGWFDGTNTHKGNTSVVMESGTVARIYGGSYNGELNGNTNVTISGGTVSGWVFGGGFESTVTGTAKVTINGSAKIDEAVFGGGYSCTIENAEVICNGGAASWVYGGGENSTVTNTKVTVNNGATINGNVYGGGYNCTVENAEVICNGGAASWVYGGGNDGNVTNTKVTINSGATINGNVYGGGENCAVTNTQVVCEGEVITLFGGGDGGETQNTHVILNGGRCTNLFAGSRGGTSQTTYIESNGGSCQYIYGGGDGDKITGTATVVINEVTAIDAKNDKGIYGGGQGSEVHAACVKVNGSSFPIYGGDRSGTVEKTQIVLGSTYSGEGIIYAGGLLEQSTTVSSEIIIQRGEDLLSTTFDGSRANESTIIVRRHDSAASGQEHPKLYLHPADIQNITVEYGDVTLLGDGNWQQELNLQSLDIRSDATVDFQDWRAISIEQLSGNGCIDFPAHFISGSSTIVHKPISVGEIAAGTHLLLKAEGYGWQNIGSYVFFQGAAIDALSSPGCFLSTQYQVSIQEIPGGGGSKGIYLLPFENDKTVIITRCDLKESVGDYNGTLPISVGVAAQTVAPITMIPGALLQIRSCAKNVVLAEVQVNNEGDAAAVTFPDGTSLQKAVEDGAVTFELPVGASLLDTASEGIEVVFLATGQYYSTKATLRDSNGKTAITIRPAAIALNEKVTEPALGAPVESELEEGAFYTASIVWRPENETHADTIGVNTVYSADIILRPRQGHWLSAKAIDSTVTYDGKVWQCVFNADGTATLKDVARCEIKGFYIRTAASPAQGGSVSGGGSYPRGERASLQAIPNAGWKFLRWEENGRPVSTQPEYTFTAFANRTLTAVFEKLPADKVSIAVSASPAEGGSVTGGGSYIENSAVTVRAAANEGYRFLRWEENGRPVSTQPEYTFTASENRTLSAVFQKLPEPPAAEKESKTELGALSEVPEGLKNTAFDTVEKITQELTRKITVQPGYTAENFSAYDVQLLISLDGGKSWQPATEKDFPAGGITVILPYPQGTGRQTHDFAVTHMFTLTSARLGTTAGETEQPPVEKTEEGLKVTFHGLSPVGIAWKAVEEGGEDKPPVVTPTGSGKGGSSKEKPEDEYSFWQQVKRQIEEAQRGETVRINVQDYKRMPLSVMKALRDRPDVTLVIRRNDGKPITIPAGRALWEERRSYYPLSYLEGYNFNGPGPKSSAAHPEKENPGTGAPEKIR